MEKLPQKIRAEVNGLAVDPGKMTGWAEIAPPDEEGQTFFAGEMEFMEFLVWAIPRILQGDFDYVACESFIITMATMQKSRGGNWSLESIGALRYACHVSGTEFLLQSPADAKRFSTDNKLKTAGFWTPGKGHANDASRHLLLALVRKNLFDASAFLD